MAPKNLTKEMMMTHIDQITKELEESKQQHEELTHLHEQLLKDIQEKAKRVQLPLTPEGSPRSQNRGVHIQGFNNTGETSNHGQIPGTTGISNPLINPNFSSAMFSNP